ncbi:erythromycin esterase family protein [Cytophagaceae bacterium ABcell3]|nr:erythromycin esterase family protein [Cytophagaceae bacterium ABcell3]
MMIGRNDLLHISPETAKGYHPLQTPGDLDPLMERIGEAKYVLLGEATHGTHEYYTWRAEISKRLIQEKGFSFIAVEGDWPDCYKINRWVKGYKDAGEKITDVLKEIKRWPTWMWANWETVALTQWMQVHNQGLANDKKIGFYGLDVYSLWESMETIVSYLEKEDPETAKYAKRAIDCFEPYDMQEDAYASVMNTLDPTCKEEVVKLLMEVRKNADQYNGDSEAGLNTEINALVINNAEKYYRAMSQFGDISWNVRDRHMTETLNALMDFHGPDAKVIVWEHNTHIGDARYTDMADDGLLNVGQLVRQQHDEKDVVLVGFGSYEGSVIAGRMWGAEMEEMEVPPAAKNSVEDILHAVSSDNKLLIFKDNENLKNVFESWLQHRAIGVVYDPKREKHNYVPTKLAKRYDAFLYIDKSKAVHPLHIKPDGLLTPETFPFGV